MARRDQEQLELALKERASALEQSERIIRIGIEALSVRMLTAFALFADCVLFVWAIANGGWQALAAAVLFSIASWCVLHLKIRNGEESS